MGLRQTRRRRSSQEPGRCGGADHISGLPDDLLLLILARLGGTAAAARTSGLSRRWRGLWASLGDIFLCYVPLPSVAAVLSRVARPPAPSVSLLEIHVPRQNRRVPREHWPDRADVASLLRAAARLAPEQLVLALPQTGSNPNPAEVHLPCFRRAASIVLESLPFVLRAPPAADGGDFAALQTLHLLDCIIVDVELDTLLSCCPRACACLCSGTRRPPGSATTDGGPSTRRRWRSLTWTPREHGLAASTSLPRRLSS